MTESDPANHPPDLPEHELPRHELPRHELPRHELPRHELPRQEAKPLSRRTLPGYPKFAWFLIVIAVAVTVYATFAAGRQDSPQSDGSAKDPILELQGRHIIGTAEMFGYTTQLYEQMQPLNVGPVARRLKYLVLASEVAGADKALDELKALKQSMSDYEVVPNEDDARTLRVLERLFQRYAMRDWKANRVTQDQRDYLHQQLGWFGELATTPRGGADTAARTRVLAPARRTATGLLMLVLGATALGFVGFLVLCGLCAMIVLGQVGSNLEAGSDEQNFYIETFAVWFVMHLGLGMVGSLLVTADDSPIVLTTVMFLSSGLFCFWPLLRQVPWQKLRQQIGWTTGRHPVAEVGCGLVGYIATLPLLGLGVAITVVLMQLLIDQRANPFEAPMTPSHPIIEWISTASRFEQLLIVLLACVAAPVIEETVFRGALYRYLRDATSRFRFVTSFLISALVSSFIFAIIHPQGLLGVPPLMALAFGFCCLREWRGSLIAPMVAHGLNNATVCVLFLFIFLS